VAWVDNVQLEGKITSRGFPYADYSKLRTVNGGSGGYIYLRTANKYKGNALTGTVSVEGGYGTNGGYGGSGGRIVLDNVNFPNEETQLIT